VVLSSLLLIVIVEVHVFLLTINLCSRHVFQPMLYCLCRCSFLLHRCSFRSRCCSHCSSHCFHISHCCLPLFSLFLYCSQGFTCQLSSFLLDSVCYIGCSLFLFILFVHESKYFLTIYFKSSSVVIES